MNTNKYIGNYTYKLITQVIKLSLYNSQHWPSSAVKNRRNWVTECVECKIYGMILNSDVIYLLCLFILL